MTGDEKRPLLTLRYRVIRRFAPVRWRRMSPPRALTGLPDQTSIRNQVHHPSTTRSHAAPPASSKGSLIPWRSRRLGERVSMTYPPILPTSQRLLARPDSSTTGLRGSSLKDRSLPSIFTYTAPIVRRSLTCFSISMTTNSATPIRRINMPSSTPTPWVPNTDCRAGM